MEKKIIALIIFFSVLFAQAQNSIIHSHNDYLQPVPFWDAFAAGAKSIEIDVVLEKNTLYVTHTQEEIVQSRTIETLYLKPLERCIEMGIYTDQPLQLLIDLKTEAKPTLNKLIKILKKHPKLLEHTNITYVISGNEPTPADFKLYPEYITFDYQSLVNLTTEQWNRVGIISLDYSKIASWNGKGRFTHDELKSIKEVIAKAHSFNKPIRFWDTPDSKSAWKAFTDLGVDIINTDMPHKCATYLNTLSERVYVNKVFSEVYHPSFEFDQSDIPITNVILLIGDGNGLTEISSSVLANNGALTLTQLKSIGLIKTSSADDFTTDSAAAGTAIAIGEKTYNRAIGVNANGTVVNNICEELYSKGYNTAVLTTDEITGATPASFYAHQKDRSMVLDIAKDLAKSNITLFAGGGAKYFNNNLAFDVVKTPQNIGTSTANKVGYFMTFGGVPSVLDGRGNLFSSVVENSLLYLSKKQKPFFAMIEGAQIDTHGHFNDVAGIVSEGIDFDRVISKVIQFADNNPGTLVVITADHETSGFSIPQGDLENHIIEGDFTTHDHTATMVPVFAYGPHSDEFTGVYENNEINQKILKLLNMN